MLSKEEDESFLILTPRCLKEKVSVHTMQQSIRLSCFEIVILQILFLKILPFFTAITEAGKAQF